jgi:secreted PhoX family phosphatase
VLNHEYVDQVLLFPDGDATMTKAKVDKALAGHGVTVIQVRWPPVAAGARSTRRSTGASPARRPCSSPVRSRSRTRCCRRSDPSPAGRSTTARTATRRGAPTSACEENFNGYFGTDDTAFTPTPLEARYGIRKEPSTNPDAGKVLGFGYRWHPVDPRFDLAKNRGEFNRFGWVVEIDPMKPGAAPVKRTALGRFKHESASVTESAGRVVVYSGDDENREYVYKFVGASRYAEDLAAGRSPLDNGTLYVATFSADGTGRWLPLVFGQGALTEAAGWKDQADVLIRTRMAADAVGATRLHRPEWVSVDPRPKDVYLTLTNGSGAPEPVSKRDPDVFGSIVRWREAGGDNTATTFTWESFLLAGDPQKDDRAQVTETSRFGSPDGIWVDPDGRVWIQTDISNSVQRTGNYERSATTRCWSPTRTARRSAASRRPQRLRGHGVITTPTSARCSSTSSTPARTPPASRRRRSRRRTPTRSAASRTTTPRADPVGDGRDPQA